MNNFILGWLVFCGLVLLAFGVRSGIARSAALEAGMTPQQYVEWMEKVDDLN